MKKYILFHEYKRVKVYTPKKLISQNLVFSIRPGDLLTLKKEPENEFDKHAVAIYWFSVKIGYIYRGEIQDLANQFLTASLPVELIFQGFEDFSVDQKATVDIRFYKVGGLFSKPATLMRNSDSPQLAEAQSRYNEYLFYEQAPDLAPSAINKKKLSYHYKDVSLSSPRGLSITKLGVKRGDELDLALDAKTNCGDLDPDNITVSWHGEKLGEMRETRMRGMVKDWLSSGLPVYCALSRLSETDDFTVEFGFYGRPRTPKHEDS